MQMWLSNPRSLHVKSNNVVLMQITLCYKKRRWLYKQVYNNLPSLWNVLFQLISIGNCVFSIDDCQFV